MRHALKFYRPTRGSGNAGMDTPYEQGEKYGIRGEQYENIYDQPGEEVEFEQYKQGYYSGLRRYQSSSLDLQM